MYVNNKEIFKAMLREFVIFTIIFYMISFIWNDLSRKLDYGCLCSYYNWTPTTFIGIHLRQQLDKLLFGMPALSRGGVCQYWCYNW